MTYLSIYRNIDRVLSAWYSRSIPEEWISAKDVIYSERKEVLSLLNSGIKAYGFTSYVGHLDGVGQQDFERDQQMLLKAHLVGPTFEADRELLRLVLACKVSQLSYGSMGVDLTTYNELLDALTTDWPRVSMLGAWDASYGSGDVVQGAWLVNVLREAGYLSTFRQGDFISLINGTFYSTGIALAVVFKWALLMTSILGMLEDCAVWSNNLPKVNGGPVQLPVSSRDTKPYRKALISALKHTFTSIEERLSAPSGNPLFLRNSEGRLAPESQSSFLDFTLTAGLSECLDVSQILVQLLQRSLEFICDYNELTDLNPLWVQPPKVAHALTSNISLLLMAPVDYVGRDSQGIEDLRDLSLLRALQLDRVTRKSAYLSDFVSSFLDTNMPGLLNHRPNVGILDDLGINIDVADAMDDLKLFEEK